MRRRSKYHQGRFRPQNPEKYRGDPTNIIYRSSWELKFLRWLDRHKDVIWYSSEEHIIPYKSPIDRKTHRYFPDFVFQRRAKDGSINTIMVEVKPKKETIKPTPKMTKNGTPRKSFVREARTYAINEAKWKAAIEYCKKRNWKFSIVTEDNLGIKK